MSTNKSEQKSRHKRGGAKYNYKRRDITQLHRDNQNDITMQRPNAGGPPDINIYFD
jgi:hypothetical protein